VEIVKCAAAAIAAYLLGSVNMGILLSQILMRRDVRKGGSGNAGATNMARTFGMGMGVATFVGDTLKTVASMLLGFYLGGETGRAIAGMGCLLGHCFPLFFGFRGGKGVSVAAAIALVLDWKLFLVLIAVFFFVFFVINRTVSLCSIICAVAFPICIFAMGLNTVPAVTVLGFFATALVIFMHRSNIQRLLNHTEPKFHAKRREENDRT